MELCGGETLPCLDGREHISQLEFRRSRTVRTDNWNRRREGHETSIETIGTRSDSCQQCRQLFFEGTGMQTRAWTYETCNTEVHVREFNVEKKQTILAYVNMESNMAELMTKCNKCETHVNGVAMLSLNLNGDDGKTRLNRTKLMWDLDKYLGTSLASTENHARFQLRTSRC